MKKTMMAALAIFLIATVGCSESTTPTAKNKSTGKSTGESTETTTTPSTTTKSNSGGDVAAAVAPVVTPAKAPVIGQEVPEITAPDTDGEVFSLSDYRGKVVMIDFWGDW